MKNRVFNTFLLLAMVGMMFTACKKEYPEPPIQDLPIGEVYTIEDILNMEPGTVFTEDASVYGIITADEVSGNLYKAAFMQDRATGKAIELYLNAVSGVRIGDSVRIYLKDVTYAMYNNLPQLSNFEADGHIVILANNKPIEPKVTTIADVNAGNHLAQLIRLENVRFTEQNTFADPTTYGNRTLADPTDYSQTVIVRTSNYANFANDSLPQGTGNLTAIATVYNNTWQLVIRSARELDFDGYVPGGDNGLPYYQDFASSFGTYTTYDVAGPQSWEIDYNTAKMTGYANSTNYANEDWLISAKFSLENVSSASLTMTYIARYFNNLDSDITLQVSSDYTSGDPTSANWTQVPATWISGSNWNDFVSTTVDLSQFVGQKVCVAVKYLSDDQKAGTIEVQSILIQEGSGPTPPPGPQPGGEVQSIPYTQSFASEFGTYMTYDIMGAQTWEIDYSTAKMTGYVGGTYYANEDWLISSPVAITGVSDAKMTMSYIGRYFNNINDEVTIWASTNYTWGSDPNMATWDQVPATLVEGSNWNDFITTEIALTDYVGQTVTFAVKYLSTDSKAGTMEVQSITIEEGTGVTPPEPPTPGQGEGSGTADDPYNVAAGIGLQSEEPIAWVHGYIVGAVKSGLSSVTGNADINWSAPFDLATNVVIADDAACREISQCIIVNLPAGKPLRIQVNLMDNPDNLGKHLAVNGKLRRYFNQAGLRDSGGTENDFVLEGGVTPPPTPGTTIFSETFASGQGQFTIEDVMLPQELTYVWQHDASYSCMKASAYVNQAYAAESWLISPVIDLSNASAATLKFDQAVNHASPDGALSVMISTDYDGNVFQSTWTELSLSQWPAGNNWTFINSTADLSEYLGQRVTIAFKYTSNFNASATWEVKNFVVEE
ncbi:MAG: nucleic acid-binding domain-containing protein [bacterium F082]|nr:MAG: nucleic acid-binding domain-containing protein [bacterium F082]KWW28558.1 MAG: nucleic acid-binding domain-containing protein [bacterium P201]